MAARGHRTVPHTADLRIEAWAATREECLAEAVRGLVGSFTDLSQGRAQRTAHCHIPAGLDEDVLAAVLDEVIYRMDADDELPVSVTIRAAADGGVDLVLSLASVRSVEITGAVPKAVSFHELRCSADAGGRWSASATVDV